VNDVDSRLKLLFQSRSNVRYIVSKHKKGSTSNVRVRIHIERSKDGSNIRLDFII